VIRLLWLEGLSRATSHQSLLAQYGNSVLPQWSVYEWIGRCKNGHTNVIHEEGAERTFTAINEDNIEHAYDMILLDR
jgi:hypothetical protein